MSEVPPFDAFHSFNAIVSNHGRTENAVEALLRHLWKKLVEAAQRSLELTDMLRKVATHYVGCFYCLPRDSTPGVKAYIALQVGQGAALTTLCYDLNTMDAANTRGVNSEESQKKQIDRINLELSDWDSLSEDVLKAGAKSFLLATNYVLKYKRGDDYLSKSITLGKGITKMCFGVKSDCCGLERGDHTCTKEKFKSA